MKKIYLLFAMAGIAASAMAQTFVSTTPSKKNVVLEEFTGINCTFCPDGHKRAQQIKSDNEGRVVLINVHTGGYATPGTGQPDYTSNYGDAIAAQTGLTGYPAGTVNRHVFAGMSQGSSGTAMNRNNWESAAYQIMDQNSPVNVAVQTEFNFDTRELNVKVEVYYTGSAQNGTNYLNVGILQNNVAGYQLSGSTYNPDYVLPDGSYNHQHMFRNFFTGQWGEEITETTTGSFFSAEYSYVVPSQIKSVDVFPQFLEVFAFVAESHQEILTGTSKSVEIPMENKTDLVLENVGGAPTGGICATTYTPSVKITNNGSNDVKTFTVSAIVNGVNNDKKFDGTLSAGQSTTLTWDPISLPGGAYSVAIGSPSGINGGKLLDIDMTNSLGVKVSGLSFLDNKVLEGYKLGFDNSTIPNFGFDANTTPNGTIRQSTSTPLGAKSTFGAYQMYLHSSWGFAGRPTAFLLGKANLSAMSKPEFVYWYAYSEGDQAGSTPPVIKIQVSNDCGSSWSDAATETCRTTGNPVDLTKLFMPNATQYRRIVVSLDQFKTNDKAILRIEVTPGTSGNALWLDEFQLVSNASSVEESSNVVSESVNVYPNPFNDQTNVEVNLTENTNVGVAVYDALGRAVVNVANQNLSAGKQLINVNTASLEKGVYIIKVSGNNTVISNQVIVKE